MYALRGLGAAPFTCTSSYCKGTTDAERHLLTQLQTKLWSCLNNAGQPPGTVTAFADGLIGLHTQQALDVAAGLAVKYNVAHALATFTKASYSSIATNAEKLIPQLDMLDTALTTDSGINPDDIEIEVDDHGVPIGVKTDAPTGDNAVDKFVAAITAKFTGKTPVTDPNTGRTVIVNTGSNNAGYIALAAVAVAGIGGYFFLKGRSSSAPRPALAGHRRRRR